MLTFPVAALVSVTPSENTSPAELGSDAGFESTAEVSSSGAVYSQVTADKAPELEEGREAVWEEEKSTSRGR